MNENPAYKSGFATLIGRPNVGKSTLMNRLIGQKIAITSNKPQTTRNRIQTVLTLDEGQIVFLDTPAFTRRKQTGRYMVNVAEHTLNDVDVILWLVEPTNFIGAGERHIIEQLKKTKTPVILVINKTDTVKKDDILAFIDTYRKELDFCEIVPVSALKGDNTDVLIQCILKYLPTVRPFMMKTPSPISHASDCCGADPGKGTASFIRRDPSRHCRDGGEHERERQHLRHRSYHYL